MLGYKDFNDFHDLHDLQYDPLFKDVLRGNLASKPTLTRFDNILDKQSVFALCNAWIKRHAESLEHVKKVDIGIDATDDPTTIESFSWLPWSDYAQ